VSQAGIPQRAANSAALSAEREATARTEARGSREKASACAAAMKPLPTIPIPT